MGRTFWANFFKSACKSGPPYGFPDLHFGPYALPDPDRGEVPIPQLASFLCRTHGSVVITDEVTAALVRDQQKWEEKTTGELNN